MASARGSDILHSGRESTRTLPERVGQFYYTHGLFCSSHPVSVIIFAVAVVLLCCYPLLNLPLPGNVPQQFAGNFSFLKNTNSSDAGDGNLPRWFTGPSKYYVQQVVMKTTVSPWTDDLVLTDAFRAPLAEVFKLLEVIHNYQLDNSSLTLSHVCLHVESAKANSDKKMALPEYNCLILSPANLWQQNKQVFQEDANLLGTIFSYQNLQKGKTSLAEILFGMHMKDTGIKRYPLRTRQRILQYAVTLVLEGYDSKFVDGLRRRLTQLYPLHQPLNSASPAHRINVDGISNVSTLPQAGSEEEEIFHIYFPGQFNLQEFFPLTMTYIILFVYMYFSTRKIELVKSKVGMAFSAVVTVLASLSMSIGLCFFFGLTLTMTGKEIFPYLVVIVGLENILVLTKSVVSTPTHLDVKIRVAQGLSREGWSITKNLLIEVTILTVGLFTFVPAIQEFCIFAIVGLLSDFFLQMFFFSTVLAIDIRRMELSSDTHHRISYNTTNRSPLHQIRLSTANTTPNSAATKVQARSIVRSKSHPRLNSVSLNYPTNIVAAPSSPPPSAKVPKRLRLVHFWASTRIFQRAFMVCMIVWISVIVYSSGVLEHLFRMTTEGGSVTEKDAVTIGVEVSTPGENHEKSKHNYFGVTPLVKTTTVGNADFKIVHSMTTGGARENADMMNLKGSDDAEVGEGNDNIAKLKHLGYDPWRRLSHYHWSAILSFYNISLAGHYISILPPIRLSHVISPDEARALRNPDEKTAQHFQWQALAAALDPLDFSDAEGMKGPVSSIKAAVGGFSGPYLGSEVPFVPSSPMELFLTAVLCIISIIVLAYTMVMLYRCVCSRNYAEWRASWAADGEGINQDGITQVVMEAVPLILDGHPQEVECMATDGSIVVSTCLGGQLRVWDSLSGETLSVMDRVVYFSTMQKERQVSLATPVFDGDSEELPLSDYESGSPPSRGEKDEITSSHRKQSHGTNLLWNLPDLRPVINTNFTSTSKRHLIDSHRAEEHDIKKRGFDYGSKFKDLYDEHKKVLEPDFDNMNEMEFSCTSAPSRKHQMFAYSKISLPAQRQSSDSGALKRTLEDPYIENHQQYDLSIDASRMARHRKSCSGQMRCSAENGENITRDSGDPVSEIKNCDIKFNTHDQMKNIFACSLQSKGKNVNMRARSSSDDCSHNSGLRHSAVKKVVHRGNLDLTAAVQQEPQDFSKTCSVSLEHLSDPNDSEIGGRNSAHETGLVYQHSSQLQYTSSSFPDVDKKSQSPGTKIDNGSPINCSGRNFCGDRSFAIGCKGLQIPPIWCVDCHENLIVLGCANGRLEFWEGTSGRFKCLFEDGCGVGITSVKIIANRVVAAKLNGSVDFLELESYSHGKQTDWKFTSFHRSINKYGTFRLSSTQQKIKPPPPPALFVGYLGSAWGLNGHLASAHVRGGSTGSLQDWDSLITQEDTEEDIHCIKLNTTRAHQQPITVLDSEGGRVLTGSQDHTLKVFRLEDQLPLYTLHGHCGPITCLFIDQMSPMMSGSGSQDGLLCVWDLLTGTCMYNLQAHDGSVTALTYSASYVISLGTDERLCVWERFQGHLLNTIQVSHTYCSSMVMFTHNLLITSKQGSLVVWDVRTGDPVRVVKLGHTDNSVFVKQILLLRDSVACDYGKQLRIVRFPLVVTNKYD